MAKKASQGNKSSTKRSTSSRGRRSSSNSSSDSLLDKARSSFDFRKVRGLNYENALRKVSANPWAMYVAGGIGAFYLARFAYRYYKTHPEFSEFIKENIDTVESSLREYRGGSENSEVSEARH